MKEEGENRGIMFNKQSNSRTCTEQHYDLASVFPLLKKYQKLDTAVGIDIEDCPMKKKDQG